MKLQKLKIELQPSWADNPGKYECEIEYEGKKGAVKLLLDAEVSTTLLGFLGPVITQFSHKAALEIEQSLVESLNEINKLPEIPAQVNDKVADDITF